MSDYPPVKDLNIKNDTYLLKYIQKECKNRKIKFIQKTTCERIAQLRDIDLHYQADLLKELWKRLIDDAISFLKSKDKREKFHDRMTLGTGELYGFMEEFQKFEPILYGVVPNYRDHIAHVFRVFLLGQHVIKSAIGFENVDFEKSSQVSVSEKEAMWCIMALTHDLGYSLERVHHINQRVKSMLQRFGNIPVQEIAYSYFTQFGTISEFVVRFMSSSIVKGDCGLATHIQAKYYQKFLSALGNFNHGVMSSIILMKDLVYFKESDYELDQTKPLDEEDARQFMIRREILRAIAAHNCDDIYYLGIKNFPFLLTVCDEMQEWGRPRLVDVFKRGESSTELTINKFDGKIVDYKVTFTLDEKASEEERKNAEKEVKAYYVSKRDKWLNVLRSAVGGDLRDLTLNFEVEDNTSAILKKYSLKHVNPEDVVLNDPERETVPKPKDS
jgi:hypothetical protein